MVEITEEVNNLVANNKTWVAKDKDKAIASRTLPRMPIEEAATLLKATEVDSAMLQPNLQTG